jgi:membrane protein required for colicin V production
MANWVDVVAVIIVAGFIFSGIQRGIMKTFLDILAVLIAIFFAGQLYRSLTTSIMPFLKVSDPTIYAITFTIFWIIAFLVVELFMGYILKLIKISFIGGVESLGGLLLGLLQGVLIAGIAIQICLMLPLSTGVKNIFSESISKRIAIPTLSRSYLSIFGMFPKIEFIQQNLQRIQEQVVPAIPTKENVSPVIKAPPKPRQPAL